MNDHGLMMITLNTYNLSSFEASSTRRAPHPVADPETVLVGGIILKIKTRQKKSEF